MSQNHQSSFTCFFRVPNAEYLDTTQVVGRKRYWRGGESTEKRERGNNLGGSSRVANKGIKYAFWVKSMRFSRQVVFETIL